MQIRANCQSCGQAYDIPNKYAGRRFRCRKCDAPIEAPSVEVDDDGAFLVDETEFTEESEDSNVSGGVLSNPSSDSSEFEFDEDLIAAASAEYEHDLRALPRPRRSTRSTARSTGQSTQTRSRKKNRKKKKRPQSSSGLSPKGRAVGAIVAAALAAFFAVTKLGPLSLISSRPVPVDIASWETTRIGPTGMSVKFPYTPNKTKLKTPIGKVDAWQFEARGRAWSVSYERLPPGVDVNRSNEREIQSAVLAEIRRRPQVKSIISSEPFARVQGHPYLVVFSENYTGSWSRRTAYVTTYLVFLGRYAITMSYISKEKDQRTFADQFFRTLEGRSGEGRSGPISGSHACGKSET